MIDQCHSWCSIIPPHRTRSAAAGEIILVEDVVPHDVAGSVVRRTIAPEHNGAFEALRNGVVGDEGIAKPTVIRTR